MSSAGKIGQVLAAMTTVALLAAALALAGCGSSGDTTTTSGGGGGGASTSNAPIGASVKSCPNNISPEPARAAGASCAEARSTVTTWVRTRSCMATVGASRSSCSVGRFHCLSTTTGKGVAVSCAEPGRSISFSIPVQAPQQ